MSKDGTIEADTFNIYFDGVGINQPNREQVAEKLSGLLRVDANEAEKLLSKGRVLVKKSVPKDEVQRYVDVLHRAGVATFVEQVPLKQGTVKAQAINSTPTEAPRDESGAAEKRHQQVSGSDLNDASAASSKKMTMGAGLLLLAIGLMPAIYYKDLWLVLLGISPLAAGTLILLRPEAITDRIIRFYGRLEHPGSLGIAQKYEYWLNLALVSPGYKAIGLLKLTDPHARAGALLGMSLLVITMAALTVFIVLAIVVMFLAVIFGGNKQSGSGGVSRAKSSNGSGGGGARPTIQFSNPGVVIKKLERMGNDRWLCRYQVPEGDSKVTGEITVSPHTKDGSVMYSDYTVFWS